MTGPDTAQPSEDTSNGGASSNGSVTTITPATEFPAAPPFSDDTPHSPYGSTDFSGNAEGGGSRAPSAWTGSPYEPLPSDSAPGYPASGVDSYGSAPLYDASPTYIPAAAEPAPAAPPANGRQTRSRAVAGLNSGAIGTLQIAGGLYLVGEFGFRIFDAMLNGGGRPGAWDIVWTSVGAALIFAAVLLNGWSPWATLPAGLALTGAGIWSIAWYDGADRVATTIDRLFARPEMVVWGITGWLLVLGLILTGASGAAVIARAAGRRRGLPAQR